MAWSNNSKDCIEEIYIWGLTKFQHIFKIKNQYLQVELSDQFGVSPTFFFNPLCRWKKYNCTRQRIKRTPSFCLSLYFSFPTFDPKLSSFQLFSRQKISELIFQKGDNLPYFNSIWKYFPNYCTSKYAI
jgi:hypothetical protein